MSPWLTIAQGPLFYFVLTLLVAGLAWHLVMAIWEMAAALRRAGDPHLPYGRIARETLGWLVPIRHLHRNRPWYGLASFSLHLGVLLAGFFLEPHVRVIASNTGLVWPSIPKVALDVLAMAGIVAAAYLLIYRLRVRHARALSRLMDYGALILVLLIFITGFVAGRPWNPVPYDALMLAHTLGGLLLLALIPFTKIAHCVLFPVIRLGSEIAWHLAPGAGADVARTLRGEEETS